MTTRILTVDDSTSMRQMIKFTLEGAGHEVTECVDGQDALTVLENSTFNLMITDINMPNVDGLSLVRATRENAKHKFLPIIILTTEFDDSMKQAARAAGVTGWIVKPFKPEQLLAVVTKVIGK